jgi:peptidoglycan/xylan/chitin deacetylase (PgdA/CDA1 family)
VVIVLTGIRRHWARMLALMVLLAYVPWVVHGFSAARPPSRPQGTISHFVVSGRWVALAFADSPNGLATARVAQEVANYGDHATFFVVGLNAWPERDGLRRARQLGDDIESHSEGHINLAAHSYGEDVRDLMRANHAIERAIGERPYWLLPPYEAVTDRVVKAAHVLGLAIVLPSAGENIVLNGDRPSAIVHEVLAHLTPGAVLVINPGVHDRLLMQELPTLLDLIRLDGYHAGSVIQLWQRQEHA